MKLLSLFLLVAVLAACSGVSDRVSGTYVRTIDHEYALGNDTLIIRAVNATTYQVAKRSTFQRTVKVKGKVPPIETQQRSWMATYDKEHQQLMEPHQGKMITFSDDYDLLLMGKLEYRRVEE